MRRSIAITLTFLLAAVSPVIWLLIVGDPRPGVGPPPQPATTGGFAGTPTAAGRTWNPSLLAGMTVTRDGDPFSFALPGGRTANGRIDRVVREDGRVVHVSGRLWEPEQGRYFIQAQGLPGAAGDFVGVVEFLASQSAYRLEPSGPGQPSEWVARGLDEVRCLHLPRPEGGGEGRDGRMAAMAADGDSGVGPSGIESDPPLLESLPGPNPVIYLDFLGGYTPTWGGIEYAASAFGPAEIREIWERVAEDFLPFRINVVTDPRAYEGAPKDGRQQVIITPTDDASPGAGGVAYHGSFSWTSEMPCWVFITNSARYCAQAASHEAGHALSLSHSGVSAPGAGSEYYSGHGEGEVSWAPIMGVAYYRNVTQWTQGEYANANSRQDQLAIIASQNKVDWRADDAAGTANGARVLEVYADGSVSAEGVIETTGDTDAFAFTTTGGLASVRAGPAGLGPNLAVQIALHDSSGGVLAMESPGDTLGAAVSAHLPAGDYTVRVTGTGRNDPLTDGFTAYASLGSYQVTGTVAGAEAPDRFVVPENTPVGTVVGILADRGAGGGPRSYTITAGNTNNTFALDAAGTLTVANGKLLDFEALAATGDLRAPRPRFDLRVRVIDVLDPGRTQPDRRVLVQVEDVNEPPTLSSFKMGRATSSCFSASCVFPMSVLEHAPSGTVVGTLVGADPDRSTRLRYALVGGNEDGLFGIGVASGELFVAGELVAAVRNSFDLVVAVSDGAWPEPLSATARVQVSVELPLSRGGISFAAYTNIGGALVSALTGHPSHPLDPAWERRVSAFGVNGSGFHWIGVGTDLGGFFLPTLGGATSPSNRYGGVLRGYLLPPVTGEYTLWISGQDDAELWVGTSTNPASMTQVAAVNGGGIGTGPIEWDRYPGQKTSPIRLAAGYAYAVEALLKSDAGPGHLAVAWESTDAGIARQVIPGRYLAQRTMNYAPRVNGWTAALHRDAIDGAPLGTVVVSDVNPDDRVTVEITGGNEDRLFALDPGTGVLRLVNAGALKASARDRYRLEILVTDDGSPPLSRRAAVDVGIVDAGAITGRGPYQEIWAGIGGPNSVSSLTEDARFPGRPDRLQALDGFEGSLEGSLQTHGSRIRAFLVPPETGLYTFHVSSDGESRLKFSFNGEPASAEVIAWVDGGTAPREWTRSTDQQSGGLWLVAGTRYYLEALQGHKTGAGHVAVGWSGPGLAGIEVIPSSVLAPVDLGYPPVVSPVVPPAVWVISASATNGTLVGVVEAKDSPVDLLAYRILAGDPGGLFTLEAGTGRLIVADDTPLPGHAGATVNLTVQVQDSGYGGLFPRRSAQSTVTVRIVDTTPANSWIGGGTDSNWSTGANWSPGGPVDGAKLIFGGVKGRTNRNDRLSRVGLIRFSIGGFHIHGNPLALTAGVSSSGDNLWAVDSHLERRQGFTNLFRTLTWVGDIDSRGHDLTLMVHDRIRLGGSFSGAGGLIKAGFGELVLTATHPYTGPTVVGAGRLALEGASAIDRSVSITVSEGGVLDVRGLTVPYSVASGQTLQGLGGVEGDVIVHGTLAPDWPSRPVGGGGVSSTTAGELSFSNRLTTAGGLWFGHRLTLAGNSIIPIRRSTAQTEGTPLRVRGELRCGGRLTVRSLDPASVFVPGDRVRLFEAGDVVGGFESFDLPPLRTGLRWDIGGLASDGLLRVVPVAPEILPPLVVQGSIAIRFRTVSGASYVLESSDSAGAESVWTSVATRPGSGAITTLYAPVEGDAPRRFFRIRCL